MATREQIEAFKAACDEDPEAYVAEGWKENYLTLDGHFDVAAIIDAVLNAPDPRQNWIGSYITDAAGRVTADYRTPPGAPQVPGPPIDEHNSEPEQTMRIALASGPQFIPGIKEPGFIMFAGVKLLEGEHFEFDGPAHVVLLAAGVAYIVEKTGKMPMPVSIEHPWRK